MSRLQHLALSFAFATLALVGVSGPALACTICYGEPGHPMTQGVQNGVLLLLSAIAVVLSLFVALIVMFVRRSKRLTQEAEATEA